MSDRNELIEAALREVMELLDETGGSDCDEDSQADVIFKRARRILSTPSAVGAPEELMKLREWCLITFGTSHPDHAIPPAPVDLGEVERAINVYGQAVRNYAYTSSISGDAASKERAALLSAITRFAGGKDGERESEEHAALQARCYEGYPSASDGIFDYVRDLRKELDVAREMSRESESKYQILLKMNDDHDAEMRAKGVTDAAEWLELEGQHANATAMRVALSTNGEAS